MYIQLTNRHYLDSYGVFFFFGPDNIKMMWKVVAARCVFNELVLNDVLPKCSASLA